MEWAIITGITLSIGWLAYRLHRKRKAKVLKPPVKDEHPMKWRVTPIERE